TIKESIAMNEAIKLNIPITAMIDTNSDPDTPDHIIPANDDSARTIQLITAQIADAIIEGNAEREALKEEELMEEAAAESKSASSDEGEEESSVVAKPTKRRKRRKKKDDSDSLEPKDEATDTADTDEEE
ncbi:MAG: 30S ribosomal protein S2, partial [Balneolaceae bacterium]